MRKIILSLLIISFAAVQYLSAEDTEGKVYGKGISLSETTKISEILAEPEANLGKTFLIEGRIVDVCKKRGCWMEISSDKEFQTIRIKVNDGEIVFPLSAKGKPAKVEGTLEKIELTKEQNLMWQKHHAEEQGMEFDSTSVTEGVTIYQLKGVGAVIRES
ncbi:MAG: DUF4920 domain-containing protein [Calditrichaceae bacterium]|jgi:hypothetical protein